MRFIISIFGSKHIGMLITNLYSIRKNNNAANVTILWEEIPDKYIEPIKIAFEKFDFIKTNVGFTKDPVKRISSKTIVWQMGADKYPNENLAFIDVDMIVLQNISHYFSKHFDIIFTYKNEQYPINTGVILCKNSDKTQLFFEHWKLETLKILNDSIALKQATDINYPYGGADQMSFYHLIDYRHNKLDFTKKIDDVELNIKAEICEKLNQTNSTEIKEDTYIVHYKGGWQQILIHGFNFTKNRPRSKSWQMYIEYLKYYVNSVKFINYKNNKNLKNSFFKIIVPTYINLETSEFNKVKYIFFQTKGWFKRYYHILKNFAKRKISF